MLYISYKNETGKLDFNGGSGHHPWKVMAIEGLGLMEKSLNTASYPSQVGQSALSETIGSRTITIQCDIHGQNSNQYYISKALKILNEPGKLILQNGHTTRKIGARCISAVPGERQGSYQVFAIQFVCDYPYFEDSQDTTVPIYKQEDSIGSGTRWYENEDKVLRKESIAPGTFILPCIFTRRTTKADVLNIGDVDTEPVIIITMLGNALTSEERKNELTINNAETEQLLKLQFPIQINRKDENGNYEAVSYTPTSGDVITLDISSRSVYNQNKENLISCLSSDSFLSDFWLKKGKNPISVVNDISGSCTVVCKYSNKYIEAVVA